MRYEILDYTFNRFVISKKKKEKRKENTPTKREKVSSEGITWTTTQRRDFIEAEFEGPCKRLVM